MQVATTFLNIACGHLRARLGASGRLMILLCLSSLCAPVLAATCSSGGGNFSVAAGTRMIPPDAPVGSIVIPKIGTQTAYSMACPGDSNQDRDAFVTFQVVSAPVAGYSDVYPTNLAGLGVKYHFATNSGTGCGMPFDQTISNSSYAITCHILAGTTFSWSWGSSVEFIKTGTISAGSLTSLPAVTMSYSLNNQAGSWPLTIMYTGAFNGSVSMAACATPNVSVDLGKHKTSEFAGVGSHASSKGFTISLNSCPTGINVIKYRLDSVTPSPTTDSSVVALDSSSTAKGIGVQLLDAGGNPFPVGTAMTFAGYDTAGGNFSIPLNARYYQTSSPIAPGTANTSVTFTMSYQ
ncbi:fimbrial protein [Variovorax sp. OV329]|uniref:fimbrial protein n=1 Tax=Variovorax sp. OV329 TaxID=1882825 RepID=UPI0008DED116|nr:fimbrial protein [Variovorax sp. OV329]SFM22566.1 major type 1 subunit fimbrin (pilin) [Variovorax sp. OV329]